MLWRASNGSEHAALYMREPEDIAEDDDLRFELRYKNAEISKSSVEQSQKRATCLENVGAFRVLGKHMMGFRRRAGQQLEQGTAHR